MNTALIAFKNLQIKTLSAREEISDDCHAAIERLKADVRALEGNADDPRDNELARLRAALDKATADNARLEHALAKANAHKPAKSKGK